MAAKKAPPGPERVASRSFNGASRGTVLRRWTAPKADSFFGADFALIEFDHHPEPLWSSTKWLKKPVKADLYERWRAAPGPSLDALVRGSTEDLLRACARISGGQRTHHAVVPRWVGLVRHLPLEEGTGCLLRLLEAILADPEARAFDQPAVLDGSEYNRTDFKYGPRVRGEDLRSTLLSGLESYWQYSVGGRGVTVAEALPEALRGRAYAVFKGTWLDGAEALERPLTQPTFGQAFSGCTREYHARIGLEDEHLMVQGTGY